MPFTGVSAMDCKLEFVRLAQAEGVNRRELCRRFGVSPTLGYRLLSRYAAQGEAGLSELSRRPRGSPRTTPAAIEAAALAVRAEHPAWGGRKIAAVLRRQGLEAPSPSTVTQILRRHGLALGALGGGQTPFIRFPKAFTGKTLALRPTNVDGRYDLVFRSKTISTIDLNRPL